VPAPLSYRERLSVPAAWWLIALLGLSTTWLVVAVPAGGLAATAVTVAAAALVIAGFQRYGGAVVEVDGDSLRAGRASIDRTYLGEAEPLTGEAARAARGPDCDARAYLLLRPYLSGAVRIHLNDPDDPAPYWLIATRHPQRLADSLRTVPAQGWQDPS
jgi:hypothetical protein